MKLSIPVKTALVDSVKRGNASSGRFKKYSQSFNFFNACSAAYFKLSNILQKKLFFQGILLTILKLTYKYEIYQKKIFWFVSDITSPH